MCDTRLLSREEYMRGLINQATENNPVLLSSDRDRKLFYKTAKKMKLTAVVRKAVKGGWWACAK